ncbi:SH3 domain-containing protein [Azotobacter chroococcum]|nr:SH3 domain-containing protein [Azotobacter chroococcum]
MSSTYSFRSGSGCPRRAQLSPHGTCGLNRSLFLHTFGAAQGRQAVRCAGDLRGGKNLHIPSPALPAGYAQISRIQARPCDALMMASCYSPRSIFPGKDIPMRIPIILMLVAATSMAMDADARRRSGGSSKSYSSSRSYSEPAPAPAASFASGRRYVSVPSLNVRSEPATSGQVLRKLKKNQVVNAYQFESDWVRISADDTTPEWVIGSSLSKSKR